MMMNRKERRQAELMAKVQQRQKVIEENKYWADKIKKAEEEIREEVTHYYMGLMYSVFILVLRRVFKFGKVRMYRALNEMAAIINDLDEGVIDIYDIKREADAAKLEIVFDVNRHIVKANIFEEVKK